MCILLVKRCVQWNALIVAVEAGYCLESEGNGVSLGEGGEGGPGPPVGRKDKQSVLSRGRDNMAKDEETNEVGHDKGGPARTELAVF